MSVHFEALRNYAMADCQHSRKKIYAMQYTQNFLLKKFKNNYNIIENVILSVFKKRKILNDKKFHKYYKILT